MSTAHLVDYQFKPGALPAPKTTTRSQRAVRHYDDHVLTALEKLWALTDHPNPKVALTATIEYLNRALGKATQEIRATIEDRRPIVIDASLADTIPQSPEVIEDLEAKRDQLVQGGASPMMDNEVQEGTMVASVVQQASEVPSDAQEDSE